MKIEGIIYKYTSPSGKIYIGQTINERKRRKKFLNINEDYQIDKNTGEIINEFPSAKAAGEFFGKPRANSEIIKVCKKYVSPSGKKYLTALGYKWKYKNEESSTTIEMQEIDKVEYTQVSGNREDPEKDRDIV